MSEPLDELGGADIISSGADGGVDFGVFASSSWPELVRLAYGLTADRPTAETLAETALARTYLAWWRAGRNPDRYVRRVLVRAARRHAPPPGLLDQPMDQLDPPAGLLDRIRLRARSIRYRQVRIVGIPLLACVVAAVAVLVPLSRHATAVAGSARRTAPARPAEITNALTGTVASTSVFARGTADGHPWRLAVQNIADPGYRCLPAVTVNGDDADPVFPDLHLPLQTPIGNPAFVTLGSTLPGAGFAFVQLPADATWLWLDPAPIGGLQIGLAPVTVTVCGERFRLAGFAYPLTGTLRIHADFASGRAGGYTVPSMLSAPRASLVDPQVDGVWQDMDAAHGQVATATIASGRAFGERWSIRVIFGTAGDCFIISTSLLDDSARSQPERMAACGPVSPPQGPDTIMVLPLGSPDPGGQGVGYAVSVSAVATRLDGQLSDGSIVSATPVVVDGRKYAALFIPGPPRLTWLNWVDAANRQIAGTTGLPQFGYMQYQP